MSRHGSRGSAGEYQADEQAGVPEEAQDEKTEDTGPRELRCISKG